MDERLIVAIVDLLKAITKLIESERTTASRR
jgi:hypothetical protein